MCGIAGFVGDGNERDMEKMVRAVSHRGPDDRGMFLRENVGFGHARLSILDTSARGRQPMHDKKNDISITFNGEIYNFKELKKNLLRTGKYRFESESDTEVLLYLYSEYGERCFESLNGMFAVGMYDFKKKKLLLARDRMGKKPLYYGVFGGTIIFSSEIKGILEHPLCTRELDFISMQKYFAYDYVPTPRSIFKNIYKLEPATKIVYAGGQIKKEKFWTPDFTVKNFELHEAVRLLDQALRESTHARLMSDVPLGIFLSGGLDSSTVAYYAREIGGADIKTFSIGFKEKTFDESAHARRVAEHLGTAHFHREFMAEDSLRLVPELGRILDEPLADASILPTLLLSRFTKEHVSVALGGDGGDELFAGYPTFYAERYAGFYESMPEFAKKYFFPALVHPLPAGSSNFSLDFKAKKFLDGFTVPRAYRHMAWLGSFNSDERACLFNDFVREELLGANAYDDIDFYMADVRDIDPGNAFLYLYERTYMMDGVLVKVDRASMSVGLEVRAPFLDKGVVGLAHSLPFSMKLHGSMTKYILKELMRDKFPPGIADRSKKGFGIPLSAWLRGELRPLCEDLLSKQAIDECGLFNYAYIETLKNEHFSKKRNHHKELWSLMMFFLWRNAWFN
ncbi:asparagine synthase (glutamine-hydrolyzing) [bacterium]|nr:asparagine synthase (glutamine-hydrolyzing) [bacterium]